MGEGERDALLPGRCQSVDRHRRSRRAAERPERVDGADRTDGGGV